ncbi:MAG: cupredoxin domain-containing protein [Nocardioides sp.]
MKLARWSVLPALVLVVSSVLAGCGDDSGGTSTATDKSPASDHSDMGHSDADPAASDEPAEPVGDADQVIAVTVADGAVTPEPDTVDVALNDTVTIEVTSDVAEEIHVHGYDKLIELEPNTTGSLTITADIPGRFEVELEQSATLLFEMEVK